ncbi:MAG: hypothetical protein AAGF11_37420 [Myxococcota bacterium]
MTRPEVETSGPSLRLVLGVIAVVVVVMGVAAYWRYTLSEKHFADTLAQMDRQGPSLDVEGCIDAVLGWHARCEANKPLCDNGVPQVMTHCLVARDRTRSCEQLDLDASASAQWVYLTCFERDTPCRSKKHCPCADAYRTFDSFCRHEQKGVAL